MREGTTARSEETQAFDRKVRGAIARSIRESGRIPAISDVATVMAVGRDSVDASFARMIDGHVFIPRRDSHEIYAYDPFCADPTEFRVESAGRGWWGICGWDALGIPSALGAEGELSTPCADRCGQSIEIAIAARGTATADDGAVLHVGVPARKFWEDIYFT